MCKKYINDKIESQIQNAASSLNNIVYPTIFGINSDSKGHMSVRDARKLALKARGHLNYALGLMGKIERVRYQKK